MFSKIESFLQKFGKGRATGKNSVIWYYTRQEELSEKMMDTIGVAMKVGLEIRVRLDIGNQSHCFRVNGAEDPTVQYLYDLAEASMHAHRKDKNEAIRAKCVRDGLIDDYDDNLPF